MSSTSCRKISPPMMMFLDCLHCIISMSNMIGNTIHLRRLGMICQQYVRYKQQELKQIEFIYSINSWGIPPISILLRNFSCACRHAWSPCHRPSYQKWEACSSQARSTHLPFQHPIRSQYTSSSTSALAKLPEADCPQWALVQHMLFMGKSILTQQPVSDEPLFVC